jgi:hypothetical protein
MDRAGIPVGEEPPKWIDPETVAFKNKEPPKVQPCKKKRPATTKRQSTRRFQDLNAFRDSGEMEAKLSPSARHLWLWLWTYVDAKTGTARVSGQTLARKLGLQLRQTQYLVRELIEASFLEVVEHGGPNSHASNVYRLHPTPAQKGA